MVNASPDSKADFSVVHCCAEAATRGAELLAEGADHIDLGGEGSTPGSDEVSTDDEWQRVEGPLRGLLSLGAEVAIDTRKPEVAQQLLLDRGVGFGPHDMDWPDRAEHQRAIYSGLDKLHRFDLPLYVPVPWLQTPDRLELLDLALSQEPDYVRAHRPAQVREHHATLTSGS